ncbi:PREDICTED: uncharacterized protein LOC18586779 isoform X1 [Theobroma cacao]|uniref:Uncharacterized protein LOC18586779 isoform X1 n=1 Tax=Theobroma cacao TaxID=3641 RepID=A0AB32WZH9_THECC|nr:PREDICTED: uncharacterized protein LOC18586779 isoform X1 [Theobroma cacao]XP_017985023.1 PREDICTED: uncharacterized protein LOC18586779 isoform X1 [Theobroma cacao]XP_017985024.1 PREDICTED: uncharacterized protein LOC18586779 isoform X1 [Theobroma cacao]
MHNSDQVKQDQRTTCNVEDSTMTIEFLRARLLSERSVSKSARQRADELAKRVAELEKQLKFVSVQRRRAEKATADVLAILENNGVSDISEELDSSSDQDAPFESNINNGSTKEEESSVTSKVRQKESEELSGSEFDCSSASGRSLSWKGRKSASHSPERYKDKLVRSRNSFASMSFSSRKHRQGKSCRQIRRRESRSVAEELKSDNIMVDPQVKGLENSSEVNANHSTGGPHILPMGSEIHENKSTVDNLHSDALKNERNVTGFDLDFHGFEGEKDMEKALEHQAQLIVHYEAMERAQREWEEKFREKNSSSPDSCDPGNHSDVTEERDEIKAQAQYVSGTATSQVQGAEEEHISFSAELPKIHSNDLVPPSQADMDRLQDWRYSRSLSPESLNPNSPGQKLTFLMAKENHHQSMQSNNSPSNSSHHFAHPHDSPGNQAVQHISSDLGSHSCRELPRNKNELYALVPHETSGRFTGVLDSLKQARLSLQQKISTLSLVEGASVGKAIETSGSGRKVGERVEIPLGCSGLFRVPTDISVEAPKANFLGSSSQLSLANHYPDRGVAPTASNHLLTTSYMNTQSSSSSNYQPVSSDRFFSGPYMYPRTSSSPFPTAFASSGYIKDDQILTGQCEETGSRLSTPKPSFDPSLEPVLPSSSLQNYPTFPSYPDLVPQIHAKEGFPAFHTTRSVGATPDWFSFYDSHFRPDIHRL